MKILNNIIFTNDKFFRFNMMNSPIRAVCKNAV